MDSSAVLYASTNKVYGDISSAEIKECATRYDYSGDALGIDEDQPLSFHSPYGCSKGAADQYVQDFARIYGIPTVVFRQSCIYGNRQYGVEDQGWVAWFTIAHELGLPISIYGDGKQVRDLLHVDDLANLYFAALGQKQLLRGQAYNVGGGRENTLSIVELVGLLKRFTGRPLQADTGSWRPGDQKIFISDNSKVAKELNWRPKISVEQGICRLVEWVAENRTSILRSRELS